MERFEYIFNGKFYKAVRMDGACVELEEIVLAEESFNDVLEEYEAMSYNTENDPHKAHLCGIANRLDDEIFGFAPKELIENGTEEELAQYAADLL